MRRTRNRQSLSCSECQRRKQKCDRKHPCNHCTSRGGDVICRFDKATARKGTFTKAASTAFPRKAITEQPRLAKSSRLSLVATNWGYARTETSTVGLLQSIESARPEDAGITDTKDPSRVRHGQPAADVANTYADLIQQLPGIKPLRILLDIYLESFNWQYGVIEDEPFQTQLDQWQKVPLTVLASAGADNLPLDLAAFPAILFQMAATALLLVSEKPQHPGLCDLLSAHGGDTTTACLDLAAHYSEIGSRVCVFLGKDALSLTNVQAKILRAAFQKFTSNVKGSWHTIAEAIRDAQELGMHSNSLDPVASDGGVEAALQTQWLIQRRRITYMILTTWDVNMSVFVGRPGITNPYDELPSLPVDTSARCDLPVTTRRTDSEPPTALSKSLCIYRIALLLREVSKLANEGTHLTSFAKVDKVHQDLVDLEAAVPSVFRLKHPDTRWDHVPELHWAKGMRYYLANMHHFAIMALHRRYMFHRQKSLTETVRSSLAMLELQKGSFDHLPASSWRSHMLFYGTFDALVQISAVCILFPNVDMGLRNRVHQHFDWVMHRFGMISGQNASAGAAIEVLRVLRTMATKAQPGVESRLSQQWQASTFTGAPASQGSWAISTLSTSEGVEQTILNTPHHNALETSSLLDSGNLSVAEDWPGIDSDLLSSFVFPEDQTSASSDQQVETPQLQNLAPMLPTRDLLFHNVSAAPRFGNEADRLNGSCGVTDLVGKGDHSAWRFDGDFDSDTVWHYLNQL